MTLTLSSEIQRYIDEQIKIGCFPTPEAVIEDAINKSRADVEPKLDAETDAAISRGLEQIERGEVVDFQEVKQYWKAKLGQG